MRQIRLFHSAALKRENRQRVDRIVDVNAGFAGGKGSQQLIEKLLNP
ncbi:MAG: hypothetical protein V3T45_06525 [Nitrospinaceae bacterium]